MQPTPPLGEDTAARLKPSVEPQALFYDGAALSAVDSCVAGDFCWRAGRATVRTDTAD